MTTRSRRTWLLVALAVILGVAVIRPTAFSPSLAKTRVSASTSLAAFHVGAATLRTPTPQRGSAPTYDEHASGTPVAAEAAPSAARFVVDDAGVARVFVQDGQLQVSTHALTRLTERGISLDRLDGLVSNQQGFSYFHDGVWKVGYYDQSSGLFAGTVNGQVTTVIGNASPNYIGNLMAAQPPP